MRKLLNTLFVTRQESYLRKEGESVVIEKDKQVLLRVPIHNLESVVTFGNVMASPHLLGFCAEKGVAVTMLTEYGRFLARVEGPVSGNVHLRRAQHVSSLDSVKKGDLARSFVIGKILNARSVLQRRVRDHGETHTLLSAIGALETAARGLKEPNRDVAHVRGVEGDAAACYFGVFNELLLVRQEEFSISDRNRRPPTDPMNALLSFLYTLLAHDCRGALEGVGLDPQVGFLHELRSGRPSLALDLMEEFRAFFADRLAVSLVNLQQVKAKDFKTTETGAVVMSDDLRKTILMAWQKKKQEDILHPFLKEKVKVGLLPHVQALLLARHLRGDLDCYPPFIWK